MHRIDTAGNVGGLFVPPNPLTGQQAVRVDSAWLNDIQENLIGVLTSAAIAPVKGNYGQLSAAVTALAVVAAQSLLGQANTWTALQILSGDPVTALGAATKQYVDGIAQGIRMKPAVRVASTANIAALTGLLTVDGVVLSAGDRVLVKNQAAPSANGIYVAAAGAWTRAADMGAWVDVPGAYTWALEGTANTDTPWACTSDAGGTLNTTAITWTALPSALYAAGTGLALTGSTFSLAPIATMTLLANITAGPATPTAITMAQLAAALPVVVGDTGAGGTQGIVPAPPAGSAAAGYLLRADGVFGVPLSFESPEEAVSIGGSGVVAHGLPVVKRWQAYLRCKVAEQQFSAGDEVEVYFQHDTAGDNGLMVWVSGGNLAWQFGSGANLELYNAAGVTYHVTPANWRLVIRASPWF